MSFWDQFQEAPPLESVKKQPENGVKNVPLETKQPDFWSQFEEIKEPSLGSDIGRNVAGVLGRAFTGVVGIPGDIESIGRSVIAGRQKGKGGLVGKISEKNVLPTSEELKERMYEVHPELRPQGKAEEIAHEIAGDYLLAPGGAARKLVISGLSNLAKETAKDLGASDTAQVGTKIVTGILASRFNQKNVKDYINSLYNKSDRSLPVNALVPAKRAETFLLQIENKIKQGGITDWKEKLLKQVDYLKTNMKDGKIKVTALNQAIKDINTELAKKGISDIERFWLTKINAATKHELKQYGKTNPQFMKNWVDANASFAGYKQSLIAQKQIDKFKESGILKGSYGLLAHALIHPAAAAQSMAALASLYGVKKSTELLQRVFSNPVLASYYIKATTAAAKENAPQLISNLAKLDKGLKRLKKKSEEDVNDHKAN